MALTEDLKHVSSGDTEGQLPYWESANSKWVNTNGNEITWDSANSNLNIGANGSLNVGVSANVGIDYQIAGITVLDATGANNIHLGANVSTSGSHNTVLGHSAGETANSGATHNTLVGHQAGRAINGGDYNTGIGCNSLYNVANGIMNTGVGYQALSACRGIYNTGSGAQSGLQVSTGQYNTLSGYQAGYAIGAANNNTVSGAKAGRYLDGANNVIAGYEAGYGGGNHTNCVLLGFQAARNLTDLSNKLYIENSNSNSPLIYGDFGTNFLRINGNLDIQDAANTHLRLSYTANANYVEIETNSNGDLLLSSSSNETYIGANGIENLNANDIISNNRMRIGTGTTFESFYQEEGDLYSENGKCFWGNGINARAEAYGIGLQIRESEVAKTLTYNIDATFTAATATIAKAGETFVSDGVIAGDFLVVTSSTPDFTGGTGEILTVTETTIVVSLGASGTAVLGDLTDVNFVVYNSPLVAFLDNGDLFFTVGQNEDAAFHVRSPYGNNIHAIDVVAVAGSDGHAVMNIDIDAANKSDVAGIEVNYDATGFTSDDKVGQTIKAVIDNTGATAGDFHCLEVSVADPSNTDVEVEAVAVGPAVAPIAQYLADAATLAAGYVYDSSATTYTDRTTEFGSAVSNVQIFVENNDQILLASLAKWDVIKMALAVFSSQNILPTFEYIEDDGDWIPFTPSDATNGLKQNGGIHWNKDDLTTWGVRTVNEVTGDVGAVDYYWIRMTRNKAVVAPNVPTESIISIQTLGAKFEWDANGNAFLNTVAILDGITAPSAISGRGQFFIDSADGDLKFIFGDGTTKTILTDT